MKVGEIIHTWCFRCKKEQKAVFNEREEIVCPGCKDNLRKQSYKDFENE
ncbi:hypothetical protein [Tenacibaculum aiptasiae]|nr:hypothetical protein [Tenacibaculum aiptasiae]